jgi:hypothetical protein
MRDIRRTNRRMLIATAAALTFLWAIAHPISAQGQPAGAQAGQQQGVTRSDRASTAFQQRLLDDLTRDLEQLEAAQARGDCAAYEKLASQLADGGLTREPIPQEINPEAHDRQKNAMQFINELLPPGTRSSLRDRFARIIATGCPPRQGSNTQRPPAEPEPAEDILQEAPIPKTLIEAGGSAPDEPLRDVGGEVGVELDVESWGLDLPIIGIGFQRDGPQGMAPERPAGATNRRISTRGGRASVEIGSLRAALAYAQGNGRTTFDIPGGGDLFDTSQFNTGIVYGALSPGGNSGVVTPFGVDGTTEVDLERVVVRVDATLVEDVPDPSKDGLEYSFGLRAYGEMETRGSEYRGAAVGAANLQGFLFEFSQMREQSLSDRFLGAGLLGQSTLHFGPGDVGLGTTIIRLEVLGGAYRRNSTLDSRERNHCTFCALPDQDFTLDIRDEDGGWGFVGEAGVTVEVGLSPAISIRGQGATQYRSQVGAIFNPTSGDQVFFDRRTTGIATENSRSWGAAAGLVIRLGQ